LLDPGEAAALALAITIKADGILADDGEARLAATEAGFFVVGTLGVLVEGHKQGRLDFESALADLLQTNYRIRPDVVAAARRSIG